MNHPAASFCLLTVLAAASASAHHSHTRFDLERVVALQGTVVRYEWKNPHVYLTIDDEAGAEWLIETDPTPVMSRSGWTRDSFAPGDAVAVRANPDRRPGRDTRSAVVDRGIGRRRDGVVEYDHAGHARWARRELILSRGRLAG